MSSGLVEREVRAGWSPRWGWLFLALFVFVTGFVNVYGAFDSDSAVYRAMAHGEMEGVNEPFRNRMLQPLLVRAVTAAVGETGAFVGLAVVSCAVFVLGVVVFLRREGVSDGFIQVGLAGCWLSSFVSEVFLPDLLGMAMFVLVLVLIQREKNLLAGVMMLPLTFARESYVLVGLLFLVVLVRNGRWFAGVVGLICSAVGAGLAKVVAGPATSIHGISGLPYFLLKMPFNFFKNVFGVEVWTNTLADVYAVRPAVVYPVPSGLQIGTIREFGILPWSYGTMAATAISVLALFGLGAVLLWTFRKPGLVWLRSRPGAELELAAVTGLVFFVLAPVTGASILRLLGYGWPLFALVLPVVWVRFVDDSESDRRRLLFGHLSLSLLPVFVMAELSGWVLVVVFSVVLVVLAWVWPEVRALKWRTV